VSTPYVQGVLRKRASNSGTPSKRAISATELLQIGTDLLRIIARTADELFNIDDLERR